MSIEGYEKISNNYETLIATLIAHQSAHQIPTLQKIRIKKTGKLSCTYHFAAENTLHLFDQR